MRTTKAEVEAVFGRLLTVLGKPRAQRWNDVGGWSLDYAACYGGWVITEVVNMDGGITHPLGEGRLPAREFVRAMHFAIRTVGVLQAD